MALRPVKSWALFDPITGRLRARLEKPKVNIRTEGKHPFHDVKGFSGQEKQGDRELGSSTEQMHTPSGLADRIISKRGLFEPHAKSAI